MEGKLIVPNGDNASSSYYPTVLVIINEAPNHPRGLSLSAEYHPGSPAGLIFPQGDIESGSTFTMKNVNG
ncbi:hypothetical protein [Curtobacterium sp. ISL-83]|uniref:hypothetical protein n=1 Tax=Curtobacterium sp. ISL-83 TaxID=2819145 RepID=UPI001BE5265C|nr:hypothetical protein [Curtobacterium sp. ISL-83]MBT2502391.1 hypothetical protein [Curtobacterium sp. ISL-83]